jgi:hypothetical protein
VEQAQSGRVFALSGLQPFDGQKRLAGAADNLASDRAMVILHLFGFLVRYQIGPCRSPLAHLQPGFPQVTYLRLRHRFRVK